MYIVLKIFITAITVIAIGEIAKRSSLLAGIIASVPLTSLLAFLWIYYETQDISLIKDLSKNILIMIPPSLTFFAAILILPTMKVSFVFSVIISVLITTIVYWIYFYILNALGINLT